MKLEKCCKLIYKSKKIYFALQNSTIMLFSVFLFKSGTWQSSVGYPTGRSKANFSEEGLPRSTRNAGPQFNGVDGKETSPANWK